MQSVKNLYNDTIGVKPINFDFSQGYTETWEYYEADECSECGKIVISTGEEEHRYIDNATNCMGYVNNEGPMMNYYYPLNRLEKDWDIQEAAKILGKHFLPLCIVYFIERDEYGLALTGGGMNLSWEICKAFMLLGYLPPLHFCDLPNMAGKKLNKSNRWILAGCRRSALIARRWTNNTLYHIRTLRQSMDKTNKG